ncbi:ribonuclease H-like domain-containing protein [Tanacetum coccineum]|uniref:Ribonuclease H-like domain-containing protein n=1 Tax=Tanacetum coccineum TaxID=301880 RepID=A0ABQ5CWI3_9ASTR
MGAFAKHPHSDSNEVRLVTRKYRENLIDGKSSNKESNGLVMQPGAIIIQRPWTSLDPPWSDLELHLSGDEFLRPRILGVGIKGCRVVTKEGCRVKREEAKITTWENLQKPIAEDLLGNMAGSDTLLVKQKEAKIIALENVQKPKAEALFRNMSCGRISHDVQQFMDKKPPTDTRCRRVVFKISGDALDRTEFESIDPKQTWVSGAMRCVGSGEAVSYEKELWVIWWARKVGCEKASSGQTGYHSYYFEHVVSRDWPIHQLDVKNAFLYGHLSDTVYMHQPPGLVDSNHPEYHSKTDTSLFIFHHGSDIAYLLLYVDDIILTASSIVLLQRIIDMLQNSSGMFLSQSKSTKEILEWARMKNCNLCWTPVDTESKLRPDGDPVTDSILYRSLAGAHQYITFTRADLSYVVQQVCLYMHDPREPHFNALKRILRYVSGSVDYGLQLHVSFTTQVTAYTSLIGLVTLLLDALHHAEYHGVANVVAETAWIRNLLRELHTPLCTATLVYYDNVSAVYILRNLVKHQRTKHIEIDIPFVHDIVAKGEDYQIDSFLAISDSWDCECILLVNFNEVRYEHERHGSLFNSHGTNSFNNFITMTGLIDLPLEGYSFTWAHKSASKMSKLDRFLISEVDGEWIVNPFMVKNEFLKQFANRFAAMITSSITFDSQFPNRLSPDQNADLERHVSYDEIKSANLIDHDIVAAVTSFFSTGVFPPRCNSLFIASIPKPQEALLVRFLLIGSMQILDGPTILNELLSWCKHKNTKALIFKIDFEKAFDLVRWDYLDVVLNSFGFGPKWRSWIQGRLNSAMGSILVNGSLTSEFKFSKGLKQGGFSISLSFYSDYGKLAFILQ